MEGLAQFVSQSFDHKKRGMMLLPPASPHSGTKLPLELFKDEVRPMSAEDVRRPSRIQEIQDNNKTTTMLPNPKTHLRLSIASLLQDHGRKHDASTKSDYVTTDDENITTKNEHVTDDNDDEYVDVDDVKSEATSGEEDFRLRYQGNKISVSHESILSGHNDSS
ncbi:hypothetical protein LSH36_680g01017 [Paralvinella palmiformis]|uniref:Uncharacterized protein n=1 Tax=Paralvinella palmiformis TaxID=53620 RepID=A0AAD9MVB3_9ANNE|nr:hypothetical protein LSH36_680g01017 [Paralvinella palmiformis]